MTEQTNYTCDVCGLNFPVTINKVNIRASVNSANYEFDVCDDDMKAFLLLFQNDQANTLAQLVPTNTGTQIIKATPTEQIKP